MARVDVEALLEKSRAVTPAEAPSPAAPVVTKASPLLEPSPAIASEPPPKIVEAPAPTVSEKKISEPPPIIALLPSKAPSEPEPPKDLGKGGGQHKAIQQRIKKVAEDLGFRSIIEHPIAGTVEE